MVKTARSTDDKPKEPTAEQREKRAAQVEAHTRTMERLRSMGPGLTFPQDWRPHLVCAKRKKDEVPGQKNGVTFRRVGADCLVEAGNGVACVSILLLGEGVAAPTLAVVPAEAMKIAAGAEDESATFWFADGKVWLFVDQAVHEFFALQPDLPMWQDLRAADKAERSLAGVHLDAKELAKVQAALGCESMAMRHHSRGVVSLYPEGREDALARGFLLLFGVAE